MLTSIECVLKSIKLCFMCFSIISVSVSFCNILSVILRGFLRASMKNDERRRIAGVATQEYPA